MLQFTDLQLIGLLALLAGALLANGSRLRFYLAPGGANSREARRWLFRLGWGLDLMSFGVAWLSDDSASRFDPTWLPGVVGVIAVFIAVPWVFVHGFARWHALLKRDWEKSGARLRLIEWAKRQPEILEWAGKRS